MHQQELTEKILTCARRVYKELGNGFPEPVYRKALELEMDLSRLDFEVGRNLKIFYRNVFVGYRKIDFIAMEKLMVEIYSIPNLEALKLPVDTDIDGDDIKSCLLLNFGATNLEFKTVLNNVFQYDNNVG